jgi:hypothetical protein
MSRHASPRGGFLFHAPLRFFEIAHLLVSFDHVVGIIVKGGSLFYVRRRALARRRIRLNDIGRAFPIRQRAAQSVVIG